MYPASIIAVLGDDRYRVHYESYGDEWDEDIPDEPHPTKADAALARMLRRASERLVLPILPPAPLPEGGAEGGGETARGTQPVARRVLSATC